MLYKTKPSAIASSLTNQSTKLVRDVFWLWPNPLVSGTNQNGACAHSMVGTVLRSRLIVEKNLRSVGVA